MAFCPRLAVTGSAGTAWEMTNAIRVTPKSSGMISSSRRRTYW